MCFLWSTTEGRLNVWFKNSKSMSHRYDVIYLYFNEAFQKTQNQHHFNLVPWKSVPTIISYKKAFIGGFGFHRKLSEIDRRSKFAIPTPFPLFWYKYDLLCSPYFLNNKSILKAVILKTISLKWHRNWKCFMFSRKICYTAKIDHSIVASFLYSGKIMYFIYA